MSKYTIDVEGLSKRYKLGELERYDYNSLRDILNELAKSAFNRFIKKQPSVDPVELIEGKDILWAVKDVSFKLKEGEVVGIIGRNGAGKSTLLKLLSRITEPTKGQAVIRGRVGSLLEIGTGFHPELTGRENVYLNGAMLGMSKSEITRKFDEIVDFSEVEAFLDTPIKRYSSGMLVRLGFSVAAHLMPEIFIVDEVLAVGDLAFQNKCLRHMKKLTQSGMTIIIVSHNMNAVQTACERTILMDRGSIIEDGKTVDVINSFRKLLESQNSTNSTKGFNKDGSKADVIIDDVQLYGEDGTPKREFKFGERMKIKIDIDSPIRVENPMIAFRIVRADGIIVCNYNNWYDNFPLDYLEGTCTIEAWIPPLRITPNHYVVNVFVWFWGGPVLADMERAQPLVHQEFGHFRVIGPPIDEHEIFQQPTERWRFQQNGKIIEHDNIKPDSIYEAFDKVMKSK